MKLLFDQNLFSSLVRELAHDFPCSIHVRDIGLSRALDSEIWQYACDIGMVIVTKDNDFQEMSVLRGHPPKVIWIRCGNCSTAAVVKLLKANAATLSHFESDPNSAVLMLL